MPLGYTRMVGNTAIPVWQGSGEGDIQLAEGGFALAPTGLPTDTIIPAGTPLVYDEAARTATVMPQGTAYANAGGTATSYQVNKGHTFVVGGYFSTGAVGGKAYPITAIDTSNAAYDTITVGTSIGAATAGDTFFGSTATGATASALPNINGLLYADTPGNPGEEVSAVIKGTVYARRVPYSAAIAAALATNGARIIYSQSK